MIRSSHGDIKLQIKRGAITSSLFANTVEDLQQAEAQRKGYVPDTDNARMQGSLLKLKEGGKGWKKMYAVLHGNQLIYYDSVAKAKIGRAMRDGVKTLVRRPPPPQPPAAAPPPRSLRDRSQRGAAASRAPRA